MIKRYWSGAGGVARAMAYAVRRDGALVTIANRTPERGHKLAEEVGCRNVDWAARHTVICDVLVNCTSVGMHPNVDESPVHPSFLKPGLTVFDTVYTPETTLLVKEAHDRGCNVVTGVELFVRQAALQFQLFTGREPPVESMPRSSAGTVAGDDTRRRGRRAVRRQGDKETRRQGDKETESLSPCLLVFLIGPRGSGKTSIARLLARRLGWQWLDADDFLEIRHGKSIRAIFADEGEASFRDKESLVLAELCERRRCVVSTGGGVVVRPLPIGNCCARPAWSSG